MGSACWERMGRLEWRGSSVLLSTALGSQLVGLEWTDKLDQAELYFGPILLGMGRVPAWKFMVFNFIGAAIWAPLIAGIGYKFGEIVESVLGNMKRFELWVFLAIVAIGLTIFAVSHFRGRAAEKANPPV